jgi:uncharacterized protein
MDNNSIPTLYKPIYKKSLKGFILFYNPFSSKSFVLLNKKINFLFKNIDGKRKIEDYIRLSNKLCHGINREQLLFFFEALFKHDILNFKGTSRYIFDKKSKKTDKSVTIWLSLTNQCNFRCSYCFVDKNRKKMSKKMVGLIIKTLSKEVGLKKVVLTLSGGEPLLEFKLIKYIVEKINKLKKNDHFFEINVITNGSLLTDDIANFFEKNGIKVRISLDGLEKYNDLTRKTVNGMGTFKYTERGLKIAQKHNILESISVTLTSKNIEGFPGLIDYCLKNDIKLGVHFYKKINEFCREDLLLDSKKIVFFYKKALSLIYNKYADRNISHSPLLEHSLIDRLKYLSGYTENSCDAGTNYFSINPEGIVELCPSSPIKLGSFNLNKNIVLRARHSSDNFLKKMSVDKLLKCQNCLWKYICSGGCILERFSLEENKPNYKCDIYKSLIPIILDFEAKRVIKMSLRHLSNG